jgi:cytochrome c biogenesis protein CcmG/thiol:disulfide interchange protein DsbE
VKRLVLWAPLAVFLVFITMVALGLYAPSDRKIPSRLIGKPVPDFALGPAVPSHPALTSADLRTGQPRLVNVFASWCLPCIAEAPQLMALKQRGIPIDAIAIRDRPDDVAAFLAKWGDPYQRIASDPHTQVQIALGSAGVPETFIVDGQGIIRHQHIGDIRPEHVDAILAAYESAR